MHFNLHRKLTAAPQARNGRVAAEFDEGLGLGIAEQGLIELNVAEQGGIV